MTLNNQKEIESQLENEIAEYRKSIVPYPDDGSNDPPINDMQRVISMGLSAISRIGGDNSVYFKQADAIFKSREFDRRKAEKITGVVEALLIDVKAGYLAKISELIHGEIFGDFLEMADHLLTEGYKDAAAVIAGSSLESHLRLLCINHGIDINVTTTSGLRAKKADQMNSDLSSASIYEKLDQKSVTAWLDLRNKAAHGKYSEYTKEQVVLMIQSVRDFITRNPA
jgi:hypothetical protein